MSFTRWLRMHRLICENLATRLIGAAAVALAAIALTAPSASAASITVFGGPTYTPGVGGFKGGSVTGVNDAGTVVGNVDKYNGAGAVLGTRAFRWDASGTAATELRNLGTDTSGITQSSVAAINNAGTAVGSAVSYNDAGVSMGTRAVLWEGSGTAATALDNLGTNASGVAQSQAYAINDAGTAVGYAQKYGGTGAYMGVIPARWDESGAATELGSGDGVASTINNGGTAFANYSFYFRELPNYYSVRWDASGTPGPYLWGLAAVAINDAGTAVGYYEKYVAGGGGLSDGTRAVRWDASATVVTELANLGTHNDFTQSSAVAINEPGTAIGYADKYDDSGVLLGRRAVRWNASGTAATELGNLGTNASGVTYSGALAINDPGIAVGSAINYDGSGTNLGERAVYWGLDAVAVDLNTLISPASGWTLNRATAISNTGWIGGSAMFDPDGAGGQAAYARMFLMQVLAPSVLPGDFNQNGIVDAADYVVWRNGLGTTYTQDDYNAWRAHFGQTTGNGAAGYPLGASAISLPAAVPEPATVALFGVALVGLGAALRRRVRRKVAHHLMRENRATRIICASASLAAITLTVPSASSAPITVFGGPTYTPGVGGFQGGSVAGVNDAGTVVGNAGKYDGAGAELGSRAVRWDGSGAPAMELGNLGIDSSGITRTVAAGINNAGLTVGSADKYDVIGVSKGPRAVRWNNSDTAATELRNLGTDASGFTYSSAVAINDAGTIVGSSAKHTSAGACADLQCPVRWNAPGAAATELGGRSELAGFGFGNVARAINDAGTAVGTVSDESFAFYTVRWSSSIPYAQVLGNLGEERGTNLSGFLDSAVAINDTGTAVGRSLKADGMGGGVRAVRWNAVGTAATELGNLGTNTSSITESSAVAINDAGTAVGYSDKYDEFGAELGTRAVRWDSSGTAANELGNLGTNISGFTQSGAVAINDPGIAVGYADYYDGSGTNLGERAVYWGLDAVAVDLNALINPLSGWTLNRATAISDTGWIGGSGAFDPDGAGGQESYTRLFLMKVSAPSILPGDYNQNGTVDTADYVVWRNGLGTTYTQDHYNVWRAHFGQTAGSGAAGYPLGASANSLPAAVPEPATVALFGVALVGLGAASRRTRHNIVIAEN